MSASQRPPLLLLISKAAARTNVGGAGEDKANPATKDGAEEVEEDETRTKVTTITKEIQAVGGGMIARIIGIGVGLPKPTLASQEDTTRIT